MTKKSYSTKPMKEKKEQRRNKPNMENIYV